MKVVDKHIGLGIKHFREKIGWSQRQLASRAGVAHTTVAGIERGDFEPSMSTLQKISDALQVPISQFFLTVEYSQTTQNKQAN